MVSVEFDEKPVPVMVTKVLPAIGPCAGLTAVTVGETPVMYLYATLACVASFGLMTTMSTVVPVVVAAEWLGVTSWNCVPPVRLTYWPLTGLVSAEAVQPVVAQMYAWAPGPKLVPVSGT